MIGNITKGNNFYLCVAYVLDKEAQLINSNMASSTPTDLAWEFRKFAQLNQRVQKPVLHISLSPAPGDRILDEWELCMIAQDLLEDLELSDNQFILVQHNDTEYEGKVRPHVHLVINRVSVNGKCNDDYLDYYRTEKILRQIEKDYNLIHQPSSWEVDKKKAYPKHVEKAAGELNVVEKLQNAIERAASDKPEMPVFVARLLKYNIQVNCKFTRTGKLKGISYCMEGEAFKGGDLGKLYTHIGIRKHLEVGYKQHYSNPISSLIESYKRGRTIDSEWVEHLESWCRSRDTDIEIAPQQSQTVEEKSTPLLEEEECYIPKSDDSSSESESITDNTNVVEPKQKSYTSVVPSVEQVFGTWESNKAKKKLDNKPKNNKQVNTEDTEPVAPPRKAYKSVVPGVGEVFPIPLSNEDEKIKASEPSDALHMVGESSQTQHESSVYRNSVAFDNSKTSKPKKKNNSETPDYSAIEPEQQIEPAIEPKLTSTAEPQPVKPAPETDAAFYAVIIAGYMADKNQMEIKGDTMKATLSSGAERLTVQRVGSNEVILSGRYSLSDGGWVIDESKEFTEEEKKRITRLNERTNVPMQQPVTEKKGFEQ